MDLPGSAMPMPAADGASASPRESLSAPLPMPASPRLPAFPTGTSVSLTREALREELQQFAEGMLRQELQGFVVRILEVSKVPSLFREASPHSVELAQLGLNREVSPSSVLVAPGCVQTVQDRRREKLRPSGDRSQSPKREDESDDDHEWTIRHIRRYRTHALLTEAEEDEVSPDHSSGGSGKVGIESSSVGGKKLLKADLMNPSALKKPDKTHLMSLEVPAETDSTEIGGPIGARSEENFDCTASTSSGVAIRRSTAVSTVWVQSYDYQRVTIFDSRFCYPIKRLVKSAAFDYIVGLLVVVNSAMIGIQTDVVARNNLSTAPLGFRICESCFTLAFTVELLLRWMTYWGRFFKMQGWQWNAFDCVIVSLQLAEEFLTIVLYGYSSGESALVNFSEIRMLRLVRFVRIMRLVRVLRMIGELRVLVTSITRSWRPLCWTVILLMLNMYLVAVYFTQLVQDTRNDNKRDAAIPAGDPVHGFADSDATLQHYFGSLGMSFLTLFQAITGGKDWDDLSFPLLAGASPLGCLAFCAYIAFTVIAMMNVVTGVFVESAIKSAKEDTDFFMINNMREVFREANGGITGLMTWKTFESQLDKTNMQEYFKAIDVDPSEAKGLFRLLDMDCSGTIDAEEFLSGCLRLRGPAKALDLALLMHEVRRMVTKLQHTKRIMETQLSGMQRDHSDSQSPFFVGSPMGTFEDRVAALAAAVAGQPNLTAGTVSSEALCPVPGTGLREAAGGNT